jgi:hypothetical protein
MTGSRILLGTGVLGFFMLLGVPALADDDMDFERGELEPDGNLNVVVSRGERIASPSSDATGPSSPYVWVGVPAFGSSGDPDDDNQGFCTRTEWSRVLPEDAAGIEAEARANYMSLYAGLGLNNEGISPNVACPEDPTDQLPVAMVEEFVTAAVSTQLPRPTLSLPPGYAITGLRTYLVTEHDLVLEPVSLPVDLGVVTFDVQLSGTGQSTVDWGDGTVTTHDTGGTGYPDGAIDHAYTDVGTVDITVTDTWTVSYEAGPFVGTIEAPLAPVTLAGVGIEERQPVRQR